MVPNLRVKARCKTGPTEEIPEGAAACPAVDFSEAMLYSSGVFRRGRDAASSLRRLGPEYV
jgi:hypothetical protein